MTVFQSDRAAADLNPVEEGTLRALASLGFNPTVADIGEFAAGFTNQRWVPYGELRAALYCLDALGWCAPKGSPLDATIWYITDQGRVALQGVKS